MANYPQNGINFTNVKEGGKVQFSSPIWTGQNGVDQFVLSDAKDVTLKGK